MGNSVDRGCADAVLRCVANAQPALRHAVNCKVKAGECAGCTLEGLLAKHGFHFDTALKELDSVKLLELLHDGPGCDGVHTASKGDLNDPYEFWSALIKHGLEDLVTCHATCSVQCECGAGSETNEKLNTITIDCDPLDEALRLGTVLSLEHKLRSYTSKVCQSDEDMWDCSQCHKRKPPIHQVTFSDNQELLVFQLDRFDGQYTSAKIDLQIEFPDDLDMSPYMTHHLRQGQSGQSLSLGGMQQQPLPQQQQQLLPQPPSLLPQQKPQLQTFTALMRSSAYKLYSVLVHTGDSLQDGNYVVFLRTNGHWLCEKGDSLEHPVSAAHVHLQRAYMLFYKRVALEQSVAIPIEDLTASDPVPSSPWDETEVQEVKTWTDNKKSAEYKVLAQQSLLVAKRSHTQKLETELRVQQESARTSTAELQQQVERLRCMRAEVDGSCGRIEAIRSAQEMEFEEQRKRFKEAERKHQQEQETSIAEVQQLRSKVCDLDQQMQLIVLKQAAVGSGDRADQASLQAKVDKVKMEADQIQAQISDALVGLQTSVESILASAQDQKQLRKARALREREKAKELAKRAEIAAEEAKAAEEQCEEEDVEMALLSASLCVP